MDAFYVRFYMIIFQLRNFTFATVLWVKLQHSYMYCYTGAPRFDQLYLRVSLDLICIRKVIYYSLFISDTVIRFPTKSMENDGRD